MSLIHLRLFFYLFILMGQTSLALANQAVPSQRATDIMTNQQQGNCIACHDLPGISGLSSNFAPSLKGVGAKWTREELIQWVTDARMIKPDTLMPPYGSIEGLVKVNPPRTVLTKEQIRDVVNTMQTWR
jgi:sulfur-oxidizing protein SoxX